MTEGHEEEPLDDLDQLEQVWDLGLQDLFAGGGEVPAAEPAPGDHCGRFLLIEEIAQGGMGRVFRALDEKLDRPVAVKILRERLVRDDQMTARFLEEARIAAQLQHPGIVPVYDVGLDAQDRPWFSMKLVEGRTLSELLDQRRRPDEELSRFLGIFAAVCQAVGYAHNRGVIHRDLKPANVMVGSFGEVQVLDWGFAKILQTVQRERQARAPATDAAATSSGDSSRSVSGSVLGTPRYMSPEQARGEIEKLDERTDVFALGAMLCEILSDQPPWGRSSDEDPITRAARGDLSIAHAALDSCAADPELVALTRSCLQVEVDRRPAGASALAQALGDYLAAAEARIRSARIEAEAALASAAHERRARYLTITLGLLVLTIAAAGVFFVWRSDVDRRDELARRRERLRAVLNDARDHASRAEWTLAVDAIERGHLVLGENPPGNLVADFDQTRNEVEQRRISWEKAEQERARRREFQSSLDAIRVTPMDEPGKGGAEFAECFASYGYDVDNQSPELSYLDIAKLPGDMQETIRLALDDWASRERAIEARFSSRPSPREERDPATVRHSRRLLELAQFLDRDPWRRRLRAAVIDDDQTDLALIAAEAEARAVDPKDAVLLATTIQRGGDIEGALSILRRSWARHPGDVWLNHHIALFLQLPARSAQLRTRDAEIALRHAHMALALAPESPFLRDHLLELLVEAGCDDEVARLLIDWRDEISEDRIGRLATRLDHAAALRLLEAALGDRPESVDLHLRLVSEHLRVADFKAAEAAARRGIDQAAERAPLLCALAELLLDSGRIDDAADAIAGTDNDEELRRMRERIARWRRATTLGSAADFPIPRERARLLEMRGDTEAALDVWFGILAAGGTDDRQGRGPGPRRGRGLGPGRGAVMVGDGRGPLGMGPGPGQGQGARQLVAGARSLRQDALAAVLDAAAKDPGRARELVGRAAEALETLIPEGGLGTLLEEDLRIAAALADLRHLLRPEELERLDAAWNHLLGRSSPLARPGEGERPPPPDDSGPGPDRLPPDRE